MLRRLFAVCLFAMAASACSGGSPDGAPDATDAAAPSTTTTPVATAVSPTTSAAPIPDIETGLLAHYPMEGSAPGVVGSATAFDGSGTSMVLDPDGLDLGDTFTISMWLRADPGWEHQGVMLSDHMAGECRPPSPSWILRYDVGAGAFFSVYDDTAECGTHYAYGSAADLGDAEWHHLAVVAAPGALDVYFDCSPAFSDAIGLALPDGPHELRAGNQSGDPESTAFTGSLDEVRVYDRALTPVDVGGLCSR